MSIVFQKYCFKNLSSSTCPIDQSQSLTYYKNDQPYNSSMIMHNCSFLAPFLSPCPLIGFISGLMLEVMRYLICKFQAPDSYIILVLLLSDILVLILRLPIIQEQAKQTDVR